MFIWSLVGTFVFLKSSRKLFVYNGLAGLLLATLSWWALNEIQLENSASYSFASICIVFLVSYVNGVFLLPVFHVFPQELIASWELRPTAGSLVLSCFFLAGLVGFPFQAPSRLGTLSVLLIALAALLFPLSKRLVVDKEVPAIDVPSPAVKPPLSCLSDSDTCYTIKECLSTCFCILNMGYDASIVDDRLVQMRHRRQQQPSSSSSVLRSGEEDEEVMTI